MGKCARANAKWLKQINVQVQKVSEVVAEITAGSEQQTEGVTQVNTAIEQMNQVTQSTAASAEESAGAAEEMSGQAEEMRGLVTQFKLSTSGGRQKAQPAAPGAAIAVKAKPKQAGRPAAAHDGGQRAKSKAAIPFDDDDALTSF